MANNDKLCGVVPFDTNENFMAVGMCMGMSLGLLFGQVFYKSSNISLGMCMGMSVGMCIGTLIHKKINTNDEQILRYMRMDSDDFCEYQKSTEWIDSDNQIVIDKAKEIWNKTFAEYKLDEKCNLDLFLFLIANLQVEKKGDYAAEKILKKQWKEQNPDKKINGSDWNMALKGYDEFYKKLGENTFLYVRDEITHSVDANDDAVAAKASTVLEKGTGICHAKANLLAALCRCNGIPAGICYQYKKYGSADPVNHCLHAYNAIYISSEWIKIDARGNKEGVDAQFKCNGEYQLAFGVRDEYDEYYVPWIYADADKNTMEKISNCENLADIVKEIEI